MVASLQNFPCCFAYAIRAGHGLLLGRLVTAFGCHGVRDEVLDVLLEALLELPPGVLAGHAADRVGEVFGVRSPRRPPP
ncbi:MAG: hypothetical protein ACRDT1_10665 [Micromonosporaceae bacterium]